MLDLASARSPHLFDNKLSVACNSWKFLQLFLQCVCTVCTKRKRQCMYSTVCIVLTFQFMKSREMLLSSMDMLCTYSLDISMSPFRGAGYVQIIRYAALVGCLHARPILHHLTSPLPYPILPPVPPPLPFTAVYCHIYFRAFKIQGLLVHTRNTSGRIWARRAPYTVTRMMLNHTCLFSISLVVITYIIISIKIQQLATLFLLPLRNNLRRYRIIFGVKNVNRYFNDC